ncbi:hypothetical protein LCGC14_2049420 [marine sediment metagenome]|uniref:Uncharacterized protein n=1 Tax=marine sediment metagenome TaxID=412755 RepID=A0A0F9EPE7_9ZZZZ
MSVVKEWLRRGIAAQKEIDKIMEKPEKPDTNCTQAIERGDTERVYQETMTKREAKRYICNMLGKILEADTDFISGFVFDDLSTRNADRVYSAMLELADELRRRGARR